MYNVWAHCYALEALAKLHYRAEGNEEKLATIAKLVEDQFYKLDKYESVDGGWGYYDFRYQTRKPSSSSISFVNAAVLVAFDEIKQAGYAPPEKLIKRAIAATERQQLPMYSYLYGEYLKSRPVYGINRPGGSLGRSQAASADSTATRTSMLDPSFVIAQAWAIVPGLTSPCLPLGLGRARNHL